MVFTQGVPTVTHISAHGSPKRHLLTIKAFQNLFFGGGITVPTRAQWLIALVSWHCLRAGHHAVPVCSMLKAMPLLPPSPQGHHLCKTSKFGHAVPTWMQRLLCTLQLAPPSGWGLCRPQGMAYYRYRFVHLTCAAPLSPPGPRSPSLGKLFIFPFYFFWGQSGSMACASLTPLRKGGQISKYIYMAFLYTP